MANEKLGAKQTTPIVGVVEQKFEENFKRLAKGEKTSALWVQCHYMVDDIRIYTTTWLMISRSILLHG